MYMEKGLSWSEMFDYRAGKLYWKVRPSATVLPGDKAGCLLKSYLVVKVYGKVTKVHRIVWEMHNGPIPEGMEIDHINQDGTDNRLENLRLVTHSVNSKNRPMLKTNKYGFTGIYKEPKCDRWRASIRVDGKYVYLWLHNSREEAEGAVEKAREKYGFHENHGK